MTTNTSKATPPALPTAPPEPPPLPPLENESLLAGQATVQSEQLIALNNSGTVTYVLVRQSMTRTAQSDYFRLQFLAYMTANGTQWKRLQGEASDWLHTRNCLQVSIDHPRKQAQFGPKAGFVLSSELSNLGLTSYAYAQVILWLKTRFADYRVTPTPLPNPESEGEEARIRRNARLAAQGFEFEWLDNEQSNGRYFKDKIAHLISSWETDKITDIPLTALLDTIARQDEERSELQKQLHSIKTVERTLEQSLSKEKQTNLVLTGVTCFVLVFTLMGILGLY